MSVLFARRSGDGDRARGRGGPNVAAAMPELIESMWSAIVAIFSGESSWKALRGARIDSGRHFNNFDFSNASGQAMSHVASFVRKRRRKIVGLSPPRSVASSISFTFSCFDFSSRDRILWRIESYDGGLASSRISDAISSGRAETT